MKSREKTEAWVDALIDQHRSARARKRPSRANRYVELFSLFVLLLAAAVVTAWPQMF